MPRVAHRIVSVATAAAVTGLAVYALVAVVGAAGPKPAAASPPAGVPAAGSVPAPAPGGVSSQGSASAPAAGASTLLTCPVSGCQATTCHGATGAPPPSRGGGGSSAAVSSNSSSAQASPRVSSRASNRPATAGGGVYVARLLGTQVIPAVHTTATATVTFALASNGTVLRYVLSVRGIRSPTVARLHEGPVGANGPAIATLFAGPAGNGTVTGALASGTLRASSLDGPLAGGRLADLLRLMKAGRIYVLLGTSRHPAGEVRGEVMTGA